METQRMKNAKMLILILNHQKVSIMYRPVACIYAGGSRSIIDVYNLQSPLTTLYTK